MPKVDNSNGNLNKLKDILEISINQVVFDNFNS